MADWIPTEEKTPALLVPVLVYTVNNTIEIMKLTLRDNRHAWTQGGGMWDYVGMRYVTHWQLLPPSPRG